ncbi:META domain-containing protein [Nocardioides massiliensis]|uniref:Heat shock protein HslJ n=1 Tax=Nocardioides massiliensis TaxID=1325935 RepID=A0ABT9NS31_9ACTN|nr:META domain-containing protein [Nocardioides massiliensis]MDP9823203.1 heat shock protein HslJ [Nocardioides massiliensis]
MRLPIPLLLLLGLLVLTGCGSDTSARAGQEDDRLPDGSWTLIEARDAAGALALVDARPVTLEVADTEVRGQVCNTYFATAGASGDGPLLTGLGATEMGCLPASVMELESRYLAALGAVTGVERPGNALVLTGDAVRLTFEPAPAPATGD